MIRGTFIVWVVILFSACSAQRENIKDMAGRAPVRVQFQASRESIEKGDSLQLQWQTSNADNIRLIRVKDSLPPNGQLSIAPKKSTRYTLAASVKRPWGDEATEYSSIMVKIVQPKVVAFVSKPSQIRYGEKIRFHWETNHARRVYIPGVADSLPEKGSMAFQPDTTRAYTLIAAGKFARDSATTGVDVKVKTRFDAPKKVWLGDSFTISWLLDKTGEVTVSGIGELPPKGSRRITIKTDSAFTLNATRFDGSQVHLQRRVQVDTPRIEYFYGPDVVATGETALFSWYAQGTPSIYIPGRADSLKAEGSKVFSISQDTTLSLIAEYGELYRTSVDLPVEVVRSRGYVKDSMHRSELPKGRRVDFDILETDTSEYPEKMKLKVIAVDTAGNFIKGINQRNVQQHIANLYQTARDGTLEPFSYRIRLVQEPKYKKLDFGVVMDYSGSMGYVVDSLNKGVEKFIDMKFAADRIALVKFDEHLQPETGLIKEKERLQEALGNTAFGQMGGGTALYAGASRGLKTLKQSGQKKILVLFTDGHENSSFPYLGLQATSANELAQEARLVGAPMYVVSYGPGTNKPLLKALARATNGQYYHIYDTRQIKEIFDEIRAVSREYYEITFKPLPFEGERLIQLDYYNNTGGTSTTETKLTVDTEINIAEEEVPPDAYWIPDTAYAPVMPPQVVANFDFNKDNLKSIYYDRVDRFVKYMKQNPDTKITIHGHTDQVGDWEYCMGLSERRAKTVKAYMLKAGISSGRIKIKGWGMKHPKWNKEGEPWQARENRRIEVVIYK